MHNLKDTVLRKITAGEVAMRPRWYFVLRAGLFFSLLSITALLAIYLFSFVLFVLAENGLLLIPAFGLPGIVFFVVRSPWLLILCVGVFLTLLYLLVQHYAMSYRRPLLYSLLAVVGFVLITSSILHTLAVQQHLKAFSERHHVPGMTPLYRDTAGTRPAGITPGKITTLTDDGFMLTTPERDHFTIVITNTTRSTDRHTFTVGDMVLVFGTPDGSTIVARGVRPLPHDRPPLPPPRH